MKIAIIGLSNSGKTTVFNALTGQSLETPLYPIISGEPHVGIVKVPDPRLDTLSEIFRPKKTTHATIEYIDYIGLTKGDREQNRKVLDLIKDIDAVVHVVRAFEDETVVHPMGTVDPWRDVETIEVELIIGDLELVEKRLDRMEQGAKRGKKPDEKERKVLLKCKDFLNKEIALRDIEFNEEEQNSMKQLQFISNRREVVVINTGEKDLHADHIKKLISSVRTQYPSLSVIALCGKIEMEIAQLSPDDAKLFLDDLGFDEPASKKLIHLCYDILGFISFFTYLGNEVRAWPIKKGTSAQKAAGKVHSDIERGFIKAEVISFDDFISAGSMHTAKEKGLLKLEGKSYEVKDGDIINFRFNV